MYSSSRPGTLEPRAEHSYVIAHEYCAHTRLVTHCTDYRTMTQSDLPRHEISANIPTSDIFCVIAGLETIVTILLLTYIGLNLFPKRTEYFNTLLPFHRHLSAAFAQPRSLVGGVQCFNA